MGKREKKYYVVWRGRQEGVFDSWAGCRDAVEGFEGARYKSFATEEMARQAYAEGVEAHWGKGRAKVTVDPEVAKKAGLPLPLSICVDAACNGATGEMEYQGVFTDTKQLLFHQGPHQGGSNNIGEFLAIVHALAWCQKHRVDLPIYTDSNTALTWVRNKKANTKVRPTSKNAKLFELIERAEAWLRQHGVTNTLLKWNTEVWGEIPADFGRK